MKRVELKENTSDTSLLTADEMGDNGAAGYLLHDLLRVKIEKRVGANHNCYRVKRAKILYCTSTRISSSPACTHL